jgi:hypothetical protein
MLECAGPRFLAQGVRELSQDVPARSHRSDSKQGRGVPFEPGAPEHSRPAQEQLRSAAGDRRRENLARQSRNISRNLSARSRTRSSATPAPPFSFRLGVPDAEILAKEFYPEFSMGDAINLPNYHIYLKLMINGAASKPFSAETLLTE